MTLYVFKESKEVPESNNLIKLRRNKLRNILATEAYHTSSDKIYKLASGENSQEYLDCRAALGHSDALKCATTCLSFAVSNNIEIIGGVATGGISLAAVLSANASYTAHPKPWFYVRPENKSHGTKSAIEGFTSKKAKVVLIDDVITSAKSVLTAAKICKQHGLDVVEIASLVIRSKDGVKAIEQQMGNNFPIKTIFLFEEIRQEYSFVLKEK